MDTKLESAHGSTPPAECLSIDVGTIDGVNIVRLVGAIDEWSALQGVTAQCGSAVRIDLRDVRSINSAGVRIWVEFLDALRRKAEVTLVRCSVAMVQQFIVVEGAADPSLCESVNVPYFCDECGPSVIETEVKTPFVIRSNSRCLDCGSEMQLDEIEEIYASFFGEVRVRD